MIKTKRTQLIVIIFVALIIVFVMVSFRSGQNKEAQRPEVEDVTNIFNLSLPVEVMQADIFEDGGTIGVVLRDSEGKELFFALDGSLDGGDPRYFYVSTNHLSGETVAIPYGGEEERELLQILKGLDPLSYDEYETIWIERLIGELEGRITY